MSRANDLLAWAEPFARLVVEGMGEEHQPTVLMARGQRRFEPIQIVAGTSDDLLARVKREVAMARADVACFINEAYAMRTTAPEFLQQAARADAGMKHADLPPDMRAEALVLYAEDDEGHWAFAQYVIEQRGKPGGCVLDVRTHDGRPLSAVDRVKVDRTRLRGVLVPRRVGGRR